MKLYRFQAIWTILRKLFCTWGIWWCSNWTIYLNSIFVQSYDNQWAVQSVHSSNFRMSVGFGRWSRQYWVGVRGLVSDVGRQGRWKSGKALSRHCPAGNRQQTVSFLDIRSESRQKAESGQKKLTDRHQLPLFLKIRWEIRQRTESVQMESGQTEICQKIRTTDRHRTGFPRTALSTDIRFDQVWQANSFLPIG